MANIFENISRELQGVLGMNKREAQTVSVRTGSVKAIAFENNGVAVTDAETAMTISTAWRCIRVLCEYFAALDFDYKKREKGGNFVVDEKDPLHWLLHYEPQERLSAFDWRFNVMLQLLVEGNAYVYPRKVNGMVVELVLCSRGTVTHDTVNNTYTVHDMYNGVSGKFEEKEILHFVYHPASHVQNQGVSPLTYASNTLSVAATADKETLDRFASGGMVRGVLSQDKQGGRGIGTANNNEGQNQAQDMDARFRGGERIVWLDGEIDFKQFNMSSADLEFLQSRKFSVREVCRIYGVPPSLVYDDSSNNYKSAEMSNIAFLSQSLNPVLRRIELECHRKLVAQNMCCKRRFEFDRRGLYALDLDALSKWQKGALECGLYSINELRMMENQPPVEGGEKVYLSTNLAELGSEKLSNNGTVTEKNG